MFLFENHVNLNIGSPVNGTSRGNCAFIALKNRPTTAGKVHTRAVDSASAFDSETHLPAWELPVSPMDKAFRTRMGGPLGSTLPASLHLESDSDTDEIIDEEESIDESVDDSNGSDEDTENESALFLEIGIFF